MPFFRGKVIDRVTDTEGGRHFVVEADKAERYRHDRPNGSAGLFMVEYVESPLLIEDINCGDEVIVGTKSMWYPVSKRKLLIPYIMKKLKNHTEVFTTEKPKGDEAMTDLVQFFLGERYLADPRCATVLKEAFGMKNKQEVEYQYHGGPGVKDAGKFHDGIWITCRLDQFATFLIQRDKAGMQNGFKDLKAKMIVKQPSPIEVFCGRARMDASDARDILSILGIGDAELSERMCFVPKGGAPVVNVSGQT
jgi:hypothetical protein